MDNRYSTLHTLYQVVKETSHPTQYLCTAREMVLHSTFDWDLINKHLHLLEADAMVEMKQQDALYFSITEKGVAYVEQLPTSEPRELQPPTLFFKEGEVDSKEL